MQAGKAHGSKLLKHGLPLEPRWSVRGVLVAEGGYDAKLSSSQILIRDLYWC